METKLRQFFANLEQEYDENLLKLADSENLKDFSVIKKLNQQQKKLEQRVLLFKAFQHNESELLEAEELLRVEKNLEFSNELKKLIAETKKLLEQQEADLINLIKPSTEDDNQDVIVEIQSAVGGDEAKLFVEDLFKMYLKYGVKKGWNLKINSAEPAEAGGYSFLSFEVSGENVYKSLKFESGVHRVQRIPTTEANGRIHTSTVTVFVYPKIVDSETILNQSDLRIDTYRASGAGGQHINKTDSAVRITHLPTGIVAQSQDGRSQHDNKEKALNILAAKINLIRKQEQKASGDQEKQDAIQTGERSSKIRTYNYPQNRLTDHRFNLTLKKLDRIMEGDLDELLTMIIAMGEKLVFN